jgi:adenosylmethionine-8-amino-7-oxononanoate aminotransferase
MTALSNRSLVDIDRDNLIHPVVSFRGHEKHGPRILESGQGMWLTDIDGRRMIDAFAGLWCVNVGYGQESIVAAATEQLRKLPYATGFFHYGCEPAIRLAGELCALAPKGWTMSISRWADRTRSTAPSAISCITGTRWGSRRRSTSSRR